MVEDGGWGAAVRLEVEEMLGPEGLKESWGEILRGLEMVRDRRSGEGRRQPLMFFPKVKGRVMLCLGGFLQRVSHMSRRGVRGQRLSLAAREAQRMYLRSSRGSVEEISSREGREVFAWAPRTTKRQAFWNLSSRDSVARGAVERTREPYSSIGLIQEV